MSPLGKFLLENCFVFEGKLFISWTQLNKLKNILVRMFDDMGLHHRIKFIGNEYYSMELISNYAKKLSISIC